jgi:hypothetical protein
MPKPAIKHDPEATPSAILSTYLRTVFWVLFSSCFSVFEMAVIQEVSPQICMYALSPLFSLYSIF